MDYYSRDLAVVHDRGFGQHADRCAPGILELLSPVRGGLVLELGCGSGALTRHLQAAGLRVIATDASPAMLGLARATLGRDADLRKLTLPGDPLPAADAIVSVGHAVSYLPDAAAVDRALISIAAALRPGGVLAIDICDLEYGEIRAGTENLGRAGPDWAVITQYSRPTPDKFVRDITTFVPDDGGGWRRDSEHHENVLVDTSRIPALLGEYGVNAAVGSTFGAAELPPGLRAVTGKKNGRGGGAGERVPEGRSVS
jgi:SAM-dependent methyltransferase